jgi:hypothetical protein
MSSLADRECEGKYLGHHLQTSNGEISPLSVKYLRVRWGINLRKVYKENICNAKYY